MDASDREKELIKKYRQLNDAEFEIRFQGMNYNIFTDTLKGLIESPKFKYNGVEYSIDAISEDIAKKGKIVRKQVFLPNGNKVSDQITQKIRIRDIFKSSYINYKISLSREIKKDETIKNNSLIRFKVRVSFIRNDWRVDLTGVVSINVYTIRNENAEEIKNNIIQLKKKLFLPMDTKNMMVIIEKLSKEFKSYEIEIEHVGDKSNIDFNIVDDIFMLVNPKYMEELTYQNEIYDIAKIIKSNKKIHYLYENIYGLKKLANQAIAINKNSYNAIFPPTGYYLTEKADGIRCFISIRGNLCRILADKLIEIYLEESSNQMMINYLMDGELLYVDGQIIIYVFDVMYADTNISYKPFKERLDYFNKALDTANRFSNKVKIYAKQYYKLDETNLEQSIKEVYNKKYNYKIDGLVFTSPDDTYETTINYKWKPSENNTIDFLAFKATQEKNLYYLYVGITYKEQIILGLDQLPDYKSIVKDEGNKSVYSDIYPIHFAPSADPLAYKYYHKESLPEIDGKIIELKLNNSNWEFVKIRDDRKLEKGYVGNYFKIAEIIYMNYIDPFKLEDLWNPQVGYFTKLKDTIYTAPMAYNRIIISILLKKYFSESKTLIDFASGRGADLGRYQEIGISNALFIDKDTNALSELIQRKYNLIKKSSGDLKKGMTIHTLAKDLKTPYKNILEDINKFNMSSVDSAICNFSIHYFCDTAENISNLLTLVHKVLIKGGRFMFTTFNGEKIFNLLSNYNTNDSWISKQNSVTKYMITKQYSSKKLTNIGQKISVKLPMTDELYTEYLCNIKYVTDLMVKIGFEIELSEGFLTYKPNFTENVKAMKKNFNLTEEDNNYVGLYQVVIGRK